MNRLEKRNQRRAFEDLREKGKKDKLRKVIFDVKKLINGLIEVPLSRKVNHDDLVSAVMEKQGFKFMDKNEFINWYNETYETGYSSRGKVWQTNMEFWKVGVYSFDGYYVPQPNGSQNNPDYYVFINGAAIPIEAKSGRNGTATWNSNYPFKDSLYLFSRTGKNQKTVIFMGEDLIEDRVIQCYDEYYKKYCELTKKYNIELVLCQDRNNNIENAIWQIYQRKMYTNKSIYTDREDAVISKEKIINKIKELLE